MLRTFFTLYLFCAVVSGLAAQDAPPPQLDLVAAHHRTAYTDSVRYHERLSVHYDPHVCTNRHGKCALVGAFHEPISPFDYDQLLQPDPSSHVVVAKKGNQYGVLHAHTGEVLVPLQFAFVAHGALIEATDAERNKYWFTHQGKLFVKGNLDYVFKQPDGNYWAYLPRENGILVLNADGAVLDTLPRYRSSVLGQNRYKKTQYSQSIGSAGEGVIDSMGNEVIPCAYTHVSWCNDKWAFVNHPDLSRRGLYSLKTHKIRSFPKETLAAPDAQGNMWISIGPWDTLLVGLLDSNLNVLIPTSFRRLWPMPHSNYYNAITTTGRDAVVDAKGKYIIDTVYHWIKPSLLSWRHGDRGYGYDTAQYYILEQRSNSKYGLWHVERGMVIPVQQYGIRAVNHDVVAVSNAYDSMALYDTRGQRISDYYQAINQVFTTRLVVMAKPHQSLDWVEMDVATGAVLRHHAGEPRKLKYNRFYMRAHTGLDALYGLDLQPLTPHKYREIRDLEYLPELLRPSLIAHAIQPGYGRWVAWVGEDYKAKEVLLLDENGKEFLLR